MRQYEVTIRYQQIKVKSYTREELENLTERELEAKYNRELDDRGDDTPSEIFTFENKEEALKKYDELKEKTFSNYWWGNGLLDLTKVTYEENEVDEDGDYIDTYDSKEVFCKIN